MTNKIVNSAGSDIFDSDNYNIMTLDDEISADNNCKQLLKQYHQYLLINKEILPLAAGRMASGADYYLRDYMIDKCRSNIFAISPDMIRSFAGNWYIITTLEPNIAELKGILAGVSNFYGFCTERKIIGPAVATTVAEACTDDVFYQQRIESFNEITGDGFSAWNSSCPL